MLQASAATFVHAPAASTGGEGDTWTAGAGGGVPGDVTPRALGVPAVLPAADCGVRVAAGVASAHASAPVGVVVSRPGTLQMLAGGTASVPRVGAASAAASPPPSPTRAAVILPPLLPVPHGGSAGRARAQTEEQGIASRAEAEVARVPAETAGSTTIAQSHTQAQDDLTCACVQTIGSMAQLPVLCDVLLHHSMLEVVTWVLGAGLGLTSGLAASRCCACLGSMFSRGLGDCRFTQVDAVVKALTRGLVMHATVEAVTRASTFALAKVSEHGASCAVIHRRACSHAAALPSPTSVHLPQPLHGGAW